MISGLILAAGMSTRMGSPKPLLDWGGESLIAYQVKQLVAGGCDEVVVVLGHAADRVHRTISHLPCRVMLNPRYHVGRSGSLRIGAKAVDREADPILVIGVDQPRPAAFLSRLLKAHHSPAVATRPTVNGSHGHPIVVAGGLRESMMTVPDDQEGIRAILRSENGKIVDLECDDTCLVDINTPSDYEEAKRRLGNSG